MGHWVTLDDDQHVYISDGGKVLATRGKISSAGGGKERGRALAARSKAAVGKAMSRTTRAIEHAKAAGRGTPERAAMAKYYREDRANTVAAKAALAKATASTRNPVITQGVELTGKPGNAPHVAASKFKVPTELKVPEKVRAAALAKSNAEMKEQARKAGWVNRKVEPRMTPKQHAAQAEAKPKQHAAQAEAKSKTTPESKLVQKPGAYRTDYEKEVARESEYQKYKQEDIRSRRAAKRASPEATQKTIDKAKQSIAEARNERYQYKREDLLDKRVGPGKGGKTADIRLRNADKRADLAEDKRRAHRDLLKTPEAQLRVKTQTALANEREKAKFPLFRGESPAVRPLTGQSPATTRAIEHAKAASEEKPSPSLSREQRIRIAQEQAKSPAGKKALEKATGIRPIVKRKRL